MRVGDVVKHRPSGETWMISAMDGDRLIPGGWPETIAKVSDCDLLESASDEDHMEVLTRVAKSDSRDGIRGSWARHELHARGLLGEGRGK